MVTACPESNPEKLMYRTVSKLFQLAMVLHEAQSRRHTEKYTKGNGQLLVAGKRLTLGVRGPGEKPS